MLPPLIVDAGPVAVARFLEFFAARIANRRTRAAYGLAVGQFLAWCEARGLGLQAVSPLHVAAYIRTHPGSAPTVKQHLAAPRMLGDWLVVSQVLPVNPAAAVRGPKHVVTQGATPVLSPAEARRLLAAIDPGTLAGLRDRALVSVMIKRRAAAADLPPSTCCHTFRATGITAYLSMRPPVSICSPRSKALSCASPLTPPLTRSPSTKRRRRGVRQS